MKANKTKRVHFNIDREIGGQAGTVLDDSDWKFILDHNQSEAMTDQRVEIRENLFEPGSSGYSEIDEALKKLLLAAPGTWEAAKDENGNAVDQNLVISFGMQGC